MAFGGTGEVFRYAYFYQQFAKQKEEEENHSSSEEDDESESEYQQLFPHGKKKNKNIKKDGSDKTGVPGIPDSIYVFGAIFFVAGVAGVASYQSFKNGDFGQELGQTEIKINDIFKDTTSTSFTDYTIYNATKLPAYLKPESYVLYLYPNIQTKNLTGLVKIKMKCISDTSQIILHSASTKIRMTKLMSSVTKREIGIIDHTRNLDKSFLIMNLNETLRADRYYELFLSFHYQLTYSMSHGIYISEYKDANGVKHQMLSTMFESTSARNAFPCFDEPQMKATFQLIVQHERDYKAVSNMPVYNSTLVDKNKESHFQATPLMSTYLLCLALVKYEYRKVISANGIPIRAFAPAGRMHETNFSLTIAPLILDYYGELFGINYTLPKLDLMPVSTFPAAADETWGMILFNEAYLLYNPTFDSISRLENIAVTIAHEIAHLWFGDLVTPSWWTDVWLKESFATFLSYLPLEKFYPSWGISTKFFDTDMNQALIADSSAYTHPIHTNEQDPEKLRVQYDVITYQKGSSIITMLANNFLTRDQFFQGVQAYLQKYEYSNAGVDDFWNSMAEANNFDVRESIEPWVKQPGFPLVTFKNNGGNLTVTQQKFTDVIHKKPSSLQWEIPIAIKYSDLPSPVKMVLATPKEERMINDSSVWYKANYGATGYYRVNYDDGNWNNLLNLFNQNHTVLSAVDRANVLADLITLAHHNLQPLNLSLDFVKYLTKEHHYIPYGIAISQLQLLPSFYPKTKLSKCAKEVTLELIEPVLRYLNQAPSHSHEEKHLVTLMLSLAVQNGHQVIVDKLLNDFLKWVISNSTKALPTSLRSLIYYNGIQHGDVYEWEYMLRYYQRVSSVAEETMALSAIASTKNKDLLTRLVRSAFNENIINLKDRVSVLNMVCENVHGRDVAWKAVKENWAQIYEQSKSSSTTIEFLLGGCLASRHSSQALTETLDFFSKYNVGPFITLKNKIVEQIEYNFNLWRRQDEFSAWFTTNYPTCGGVAS